MLTLVIHIKCTKNIIRNDFKQIFTNISHTSQTKFKVMLEPYKFVLDNKLSVIN